MNINRTQWPVMAIGFLVFFAFHAYSQNSAYTAGTQFTTTFVDVQKNAELHFGISDPSKYDSLVYNTLYLATAQRSCVTIRVPDLNYKQQVNVPADSVVALQLPYSPLWLFDSAYKRVVLVDATSPIMLYQANNIGKGGGISNFDAKNAYQVEASVVMPDRLNDFFYGFSINAYLYFSIFNRTTGYVFQLYGRDPADVVVRSPVDYTMPDFTVKYPFDSTFIVSLEQYEAITLVVRSAPYRYYQTSSIVNATPANNKLHLISFGIPYSVGTSPEVASQQWEELKPPGATSSSFHVAPIEKNYGNTYSFMAVEDSTVISYNGVAATVLDSLQRHDTCITGPMHFTTSKPVLGFMGPCPDYAYNNNAGSPFIVTLSGDDELITESLFRTLDEPDSLNHYVLGVVTKSNAIGSFLLNGQPVSSSQFTPFATDPAWSWANLELAKGTYKVQSDSGFHAFHYTWYHDTTKPFQYAFPSYGFNLPQSISWPQDSFVFLVGLDSANLQPFSSFNQTLCPGQPLYLQASHLRHTTWQWAFGDGSTQSQRVGNQRAKPISHTWQNPGQYWVTVTDSSGCSQGDSLLVIVENGPSAAFSYTANTGCSGTFVQLQNESMGATSYQWYWPGGSSTATNPGFVYTGQDSTLAVTLIATDGSCADTATQNVILNPSSFNPQEVPNVFTPNNDGVNDAFCIPGTTGFADCYKLEIFNRWGGVFYQSQNPQDCWQPESNIASGVYFYVLTLGKQEYSGQVTVF
jgi:gliding motility-associated-like protein